jgi:mRNA interferase RelE/StbE
MTWTVEFTPAARKELSKAPTSDRRRILDFLEKRVAPLDDPRQIEAALSGPLAGHWKYRVGDYRIVAQIHNRRVTIIVVRVGNRREVYR